MEISYREVQSAFRMTTGEFELEDLAGKTIRSFKEYRPQTPLEQAYLGIEFMDDTYLVIASLQVGYSGIDHVDLTQLLYFDRSGLRKRNIGMHSDLEMKRLMKTI